MEIFNEPDDKIRLKLYKAYLLGFEHDSELGEHVAGEYEKLEKKLQLHELFTELRCNLGLPGVTEHVKTIVTEKNIHVILAALASLVRKEVTIPKITAPEDYLSYVRQSHIAAVEALVLSCDAERADCSLLPEMIRKSIQPYKQTGKTFTSFDMSSAGYVTLRKFKVLPEKWSDFLEAILEESHLKQHVIESKHFRQIAIGVALKRLNIVKDVEKLTQRNTIAAMLELEALFGEKAVSVNLDEVVFEGVREAAPEGFKRSVFTVVGPKSLGIELLSDSGERKYVHYNTPQLSEALLLVLGSV